MIRKVFAVAAAAVTSIALAAGPAAALNSLQDPNVGGTTFPRCSSKTLIETYAIDGFTSGYNRVGTAKLYRYWCVNSATSAGWYGHRTEAYLNSGASIYVGITQTDCNPDCYPYSLGRWGSGTDWNPSPVLEKADYTTPFVKNSAGSYYSLVSL